MLAASIVPMDVRLDDGPTACDRINTARSARFVSLGSAVGPGRRAYVAGSRPRLRVDDSRAKGRRLNVGTARLLDVPLPWTRIRTIYRLLGLIRTHRLAATLWPCRRGSTRPTGRSSLTKRQLPAGRASSVAWPGVSHKAGRVV